MAPAYDPTALTAGRIYHWPLGTSIAIRVMPAPAAMDDGLSDAVHNAASGWAATLGYREHTLHIVNDASAADIIVRDARVASPVETSGCTGPGWTDAAATTFFCPLGDTARTLPLLTGAPGRTKVLITIDVASTTGGSQLTTLVVHEIGHALGIGGHSPVAGDVMFGAPAATTPSLRDARTLRYLLHRRPDVIL